MSHPRLRTDDTGYTDYDKFESDERAWDNEQDDRFERLREQHQDEDADKLWEEKELLKQQK